METVVLRALVHKGRERIGIYFPNFGSLNKLIRKIDGMRWSQTNKCWHCPLNRNNFEAIKLAFEGKARVNFKELGDFLKKRQVDTSLGVKQNLVEHSKRIPAHLVKVSKTNPSTKAYSFIYPVNKSVLPALKQELVLRGYSASTMKTYLNEVSVFLQAIRNNDAKEFSPQRLRDYLQFCFEQLQLSENTLHSRINALKFYYEQVLKREKFFWDIPRPQKPMQLPKLLNETELARLFNALTNRKHKAILFTAYSSGLRVSEVAALELADIDGERMQIHVRNAKGKKDRYVNLSPVLLDILRQYIKGMKVKPRKYLFESEQTQTAYPTRSLQQIFTNARNKAGISKKLGIHSLRHSFATHLLDKGTDIRYIKDLLGHFNINTTERYLHVSKKQLVNVVSPFDDLWKKTNLDW